MEIDPEPLRGTELVPHHIAEQAGACPGSLLLATTAAPVSALTIALPVFRWATTT